MPDDDTPSDTLDLPAEERPSKIDLAHWPDGPLTAYMDNALAYRLGKAFCATKDEKRIGDMIDRGLVLLRELNARGFDVVRRRPR
jgi:hypothetical protein